MCVDPTRDILQVYLIPHSHCDAGWLKTFEHYYVEEVEKILTSMTNALSQNPKRKFSWVETSFLKRWWDDQTQETRSKFTKLFESKQLEFLMGGWVSSDEASVTYMQSINQLSEGHRFLTNHFGESAKPNIGWQIDPFGFSQVTPYILSQMCFDAHVGWRISEPEMEVYLQQHTLEFVWRSSPSIKESSDILMHLLPWSYNVRT
jgi:lysosomal alpha-mannosidase